MAAERTRRAIRRSVLAGMLNIDEQRLASGVSVMPVISHSFGPTRNRRNLCSPSASPTYVVAETRGGTVDICDHACFTVAHFAGVSLSSCSGSIGAATSFIARPLSSVVVARPPRGAVLEELRP
jgi:hypothetical protein